MKNANKKAIVIRRAELKKIVGLPEFEITLPDYLILRCSKALCGAEAKLLGFSYPMKSGWHKWLIAIDRDKYIKLIAARGENRAKKIERTTARNNHVCAKPAPVAAPTFAASNGFLSTYEWRVIRMKALKRDGARCACCGASPATGAVMNVDHIKPRKLFPELALDLDNLQVLCDACNHGKGNWDQTDWRGSTKRAEEDDAIARQEMQRILGINTAIYSA